MSMHLVSTFTSRPLAPSKAQSLTRPTRPLSSRIMPRPVRAEDGNSPQQPEGGEGQKTVKKPTDPMSPEFKARLREEYYGLGGSPNKPMSSNYFLWIIVIISALAVASKLTGAI